MVGGLVGAAIPASPAAAVVPDNINQSFITPATTPYGVWVELPYVYWANSTAATIGRATLDSNGNVILGSVNNSFIATLSTPSGVVVDSGFIYWANQLSNTIGRAQLDGSGNVVAGSVNNSFIATNTPVGVVTVDAPFVYWTTGNSDTIGRAQLDGSGNVIGGSVNDSYIATTSAAAGVWVDSTYIYWANQFGNTIGRARLDGTDTPNQSFITGAAGGQVAGVFVADGYIYWANVSGNTIGRATLDPSGGAATAVTPSFITGTTAPVGVVVDGNYIYWTNSGAGSIGRANLIDVPDPPTIGTATAGAGSGSATFTPGDDNGSQIISYTATCTSSTGTTGSATGTASPIVVTGLTDGATYTCTVNATNGVGTSMPSAPSNTFVPIAVPAPPTIGPSAAGGVGSAVVNFTPPASNGGSPILSYTATCFSLDGEATASATGTGSPITVTGLVAGTSYQCSVTATNAVGTGPPSGLSNVFGLPSAAHCTTVPSAPLVLSQAPGNGSAVVSWAPPLTGASCIAGYVVTPYLGTVAQSPVLIPGQGTTTVVSGLVNGLTYTFTVTAENGPIEGPPSVLSGSVMVGAPAAATLSQVTRVAKGSLKVAFIAPKNNGSPITKYTATCTSSNGGLTKTKVGRTGPLTVTGLSAGKAYTCTVRATNKRGTGPPSHASATIKA
jgi:hypothetical protein